MSPAASFASLVLEDRFVLGGPIGEGSLSVVYAAHDRASGREVAVKVSTAGQEDERSARQRFEREAAALSVVASAHVVELLAAGAAPDGRPYLVLERLHGRDLRSVVSDGGPLPPARVVQVIGEAAAALELAHGLGIVHRDLKPANLFLHTGAAGSELVKVLDFGMVVDVAARTDRQRDGFGGTPLYMAPEQARGQLTRIGPTTDVWALALVALTLLTGEAYWQGVSTGEVLAQIQSAALERPSRRWPWLPPAFDAWFARSTRRVPERRFQHVAEQAAQLAAALRGVTAPRRAARPLDASASTVAARTPTPSIVRLSASRLTVIGRQVERAEIESLLAPGAVVTLIGTAGIGKTRLAEAACEDAGERFVDGAWFVALPASDDEGAVVAAISAALGLAPDTTRPAFEHLADSLRPRRLLLALDGAERAAGAGAVVERLVRACPGTSWLVTSRLPLGLAGEHTIGVEPLDVPAPGPISADEAATFSAVELFVASARQAVPDFALAEDEVADVIAIVRAVEGFPLGIELAAARLRGAPLADIRAALVEERAGGDHAVVRHAVAWSYRLLTTGEQALLRQLAMFPAGLTFEQVVQELGDLVEEPVYATLRLVDSHLVAWSSDEPRRLVMLDTVRELCRETARAGGDEDAGWRLVRRHALAIAAGGADADEAWLARVDGEHANLLAALAHLLDDDPVLALRLAGRLAWYWYRRGRYAEGARWLEEALARGGGAGEDLIRALHGAGRLALLGCRYGRAAELLERARTLAQAGGGRRDEAEATQLLGSVARERGEYERARTLHRRALALWHELGDTREACRARNYLVFAAWLGDPAGDPGDEELAWQSGGDTELRALGDAEAVAWWLLNRGDHAAARDVLGRAFAGSITARFDEGIAWSLDLIGRTSLARGALLQARAQLTASLRVHRRLGDLWRCASLLDALGAVAIRTGQPARGAVYLGAAESLRHQLDVPIPTSERAALTTSHHLGTSLLADAFDVGLERGRRTPLDQTFALAQES